MTIDRYVKQLRINLSELQKKISAQKQTFAETGNKRRLGLFKETNSKPSDEINQFLSAPDSSFH